MDAPPILARARSGYRRRGLGYVCYKILERTLHIPQ